MALPDAGMSVPEAIRQLRMAMPRPTAQLMHPLDAVGRVLARTARTRYPSPAVDVSAMDGFAVQSDDAPGGLVRQGASRPGQGRGQPLEPGTCMPILTGAPLPLGADAVVAIEDAREEADQVWIGTCLPGQHVVPAGSACQAGVELLAGTRLLAPAAATLAASNVRRVNVNAPLPVRLVPIGSELVSGAVQDLLTPLLAQQLTDNGCVVSRQPSVLDDEDEIGRVLEGPERLIVTTGGTGPSASDLVAQLGEGRMIVDHINVKPGRPTRAIRLADGRLWIALPGNPVSALLVAAGIVLPALRQALEGTNRTGLPCAVAQDIPGHSERWRICPVIATPAGVKPCNPGPSVAPGWLREAIGVAVVPPKKTVKRATVAEVWTW